MSTNNTLLKIKATADILGGSVFFANSNGYDPEYLNNGGLLPNGMYIRLEGSDGSVAYISAYELDKSLGIIGEMSMSKASAEDLEALEALLDEKASKVDLELLQSEVDTKISKSYADDLLASVSNKVEQSVIDEIVVQLNAKANQTDVDTLITTVSAKANQTDVDTLTTTVSAKANQTDVAKLIEDVTALKTLVNTLSDSNSIAAINNQIAYLNTEINKRLTIDDISGINTNVSKISDDTDLLKERVDNLEFNLNKKATTTYVQGQVSELNTAITGLAKRVDAKADKSEVNNKANKSDVDTVVKKVTSLTTKLADAELAIDSNYRELTNSVATKANKSYVDSELESVITALDSKVDLEYVNTELTQISTKLNSVEDNQVNDSNRLSGEIEELECELNNVISELQASLNSQSRQITQQGTQLNKLQETSITQTEQLRTSWVRVLTSREYKNLRTAPEGVPYNDRYKYPNTVYMVVDFNKPKAIYIGDILVAQAEQKGSIGFAYTFPIVF